MLNKTVGLGVKKVIAPASYSLNNNKLNQKVISPSLCSQIPVFVLCKFNFTAPTASCSSR